MLIEVLLASRAAEVLSSITVAVTVPITVTITAIRITIRHGALLGVDWNE
jgi:uncharacterized membrane protein